MNFKDPINDGRGKHGNYNHMDDNIFQCVFNHIASFPATESHYSRAKNQQRKYLDSSLSISELYRLFLKQNPNLKDMVLYNYYRDIFNHKFCISFGFPRSDLCDTSKMLTADVQAVKRNSKGKKF